MADVALAALLLEGVVLALYRARTGRGLRARDLAANLAAGACLLLALRTALAAGDWRLVAGWLAAAFVANLADLAVRLRNAPRP